MERLEAIEIFLDGLDGCFGTKSKPVRYKIPSGFVTRTSRAFSNPGIYWIGYAV